MNNELLIAANSLSNLVSMFVNQASASDEYTRAEKSSLYVIFDAIKAQTVIVNGELDKI